MEEVIKLKNISKDYVMKKETVHALRDVTVNFEKGKFYAIMGHSGSGKSTLISIIGLLESVTSGTYEINGIDRAKLSPDEEADMRRDEIGFIFQEFYLDEYLKAYENVMFPMLINKKINKEERKPKALELLKMVGIEERTEHFPKELSGGEKQRVAIARALANNPNIIIADEPTGDLDEENETRIFTILKQLSNDGKCVIVVSHSNEVIKYADKVYRLNKGKLENL